MLILKNGKSKFVPKKFNSTFLMKVSALDKISYSNTIYSLISTN